MSVPNGLYRDLNTKKHEVGVIYADAAALAKAVEQMLQDFIDRHGGDLDECWGPISDSLSDLTDTAAKHHLRDLERLEHAVAEAERADLRRSSPVCI